MHSHWHSLSSPATLLDLDPFARGGRKSPARSDAPEDGVDPFSDQAAASGHSYLPRHGMEASPSTINTLLPAYDFPHHTRRRDFSPQPVVRRASTYESPFTQDKRPTSFRDDRKHRIASPSLSTTDFAHEPITAPMPAFARRNWSPCSSTGMNTPDLSSSSSETNPSPAASVAGTLDEGATSTLPWTGAGSISKLEAAPSGEQDSAPFSAGYSPLSGQQNWLVRLVKDFTRHFSLPFLLTIIDVRPCLWPLTWKRAAYIVLYASLTLGLVALDHFYHWSTWVFNAFYYQCTPLMGVMMGLEPAMAILAATISRFPPLNGPACRPGRLQGSGRSGGRGGRISDGAPPRSATEAGRGKEESSSLLQRQGKEESSSLLQFPRKEDLATSRLQPPPRLASTTCFSLDMGSTPSLAISEPEEPLMDSKTIDTALVIPCHDSDFEATVTVMQAALRLFPPENIFVIENANAPAPPSLDFRDLVRSFDARINYIWSPYGNKNIAEYVGAQAAHSFRYIMTIDDDVVLPDNFVAPVDLITDRVKGVCFPIAAVNDRPNDAMSLFVAWQDIEYKIAGMVKAAERRMGAVICPHGAGSFWERETFLEILRRVDLVFYADDTKKGLACIAMGVRMSIDNRVTLTTIVPTSFAGMPLPNYWTQRVRSWEMARHGLYWRFFQAFVQFKGSDPTQWRDWIYLFYQKFSLFYAVLVNLIDWLRVPVIVIMAWDAARYWIMSSGFLLLPILPALVFKSIKCRRGKGGRPDLAPTLWACLTVPIYKVLYSIVSIGGMLRLVMLYRPGFKRPDNIRRIEARIGDDQPFWLHPRFVEEPGFLAPASEGERGRPSAHIRVHQERQESVSWTDGLQLEVLPPISPPFASVTASPQFSTMYEHDSQVTFR